MILPQVTSAVSATDTGTTDSKLSYQLSDPSLAQEVRQELMRGDPADAVRAFLKAIEEGRLPSEGGLRAATFASFGEELARRVLGACADFVCPFCRQGFVKCENCAGKGKTEGAMACATCKTLGALQCDFCAGAGLAGYSFFPLELQPEIAVVRISRAVKALGNVASKRAGSGEARARSSRATLHRYAQLARIRAILNNGLELLRGHVDLPQATAARLVARCWRALVVAERDMGQTLSDLAAAAGARATSDSTSELFGQERQSFLEKEATKFVTSAQDRLAQVKQHQHRDTKPE